jgi:hypothetical protein
VCVCVCVCVRACVCVRVCLYLVSAQRAPTFSVRPQFAGQFTTAHVCTGGSAFQWPPGMVGYSVILVLKGVLSVREPSKTHHISQGMCFIPAPPSQVSLELKVQTGTKLIIFGICGKAVEHSPLRAMARSHVKAVEKARLAVLDARQKVAKARFKRKSCNLADRAVQDGPGHNKRLRAKQQL